MRSEYFKNMFSLIDDGIDNKVNKDKIIINYDINEEEGLKYLLNYIYTAEKPDKDFNSLISLFDISDKFCIDTLKNYCEINLSMCIEEKIAIDLLILAYKNNSIFLENKVIEYLNINLKGSKIIKENLSKLINYPALMMKIAKFDYK